MKDLRSFKRRSFLETEVTYRLLIPLEFVKAVQHF